MGAFSRLSVRLDEPVDIASLAVFRIAFGTMMALSVARFWLRGWITELYITPTYHFGYVGFSWVRALPGPWMYFLFAVMGAAAVGVAIGWRTKSSAAVFFCTFTYVELIDKTVYLNHYYLVSLVAAWLVLLPVGGALSVDAWRNPGLARKSVPRWVVWFLRAQLGCVYFFAGVAKLRPDWLFLAEPLHTWLLARSDLPVLGRLFRYHATAYVFSYAGAVFDLTVAFALCHPRTRKFAYAAVVGFHALTWWLFNIGMFPWVMMVCTLVFFEPEWPRKWVGNAPEWASGATVPRWVKYLAVVYLCVQAIVPQRRFLYPGDATWTEQGFRLAWHVMLVEKSGDVRFRVVEPGTQRHWTVQPEAFLTPLQARMMSTVPDMIVQAAGMVRDDFARRGHPTVGVYADAFVSINGRPSRRIVDPTVDLGREGDSFCRKPWILQ